MSCLVEFSLSPLDKGASMSEYVARSLDIIDRSGLPYRLHAMGTILEGDLDDCMAVIAQCHARMRIDCERIVCSIKIDDRRGVDDRLTNKVRSVEDRLGRKLQA
jgi:uncharacterized protein (TIGR00106 family)